MNDVNLKEWDGCFTSQAVRYFKGFGFLFAFTGKDLIN